MNRQLLKSDAILLLTAIIWGFAFVAQRVGMDFVGPFTFNGVRFALGSAVLVPFILIKNNSQKTRSDDLGNLPGRRPLLQVGLLSSRPRFGGSGVGCREWL